VPTEIAKYFCRGRLERAAVFLRPFLIGVRETGCPTMKVARSAATLHYDVGQRSSSFPARNNVPYRWPARANGVSLYSNKRARNSFIRQMSSRSSRSTFGFLAHFRISSAKKSVKPERCHREMAPGCKAISSIAVKD
jgi:hypothetical protein